MTDVARKIVTANGTKNNRVIVSTNPVGRYSAKEYGVNAAIPMSGVNGQTTNGYLDTRFDDPSYYYGRAAV